MDKNKKLPRHLLLGGSLMVLVCIFVGYILYQSRAVGGAEPENLLLTQETTATTVEETTEQSVMFVDIKGSVHRPGIYQVEADDRLYDVINQAGGLKEEADEQQVNLAAKVVDQQMIYIPKIGEEVPSQLLETSSSPQTAEEQGKININTAGIDELKNLSGIGEKRAQDIIAYREAHGSFQKIEELQEVSGIGAKTVEKLSSSITIK